MGFVRNYGNCRGKSLRSLSRDQTSGFTGPRPEAGGSRAALSDKEPRTQGPRAGLSGDPLLPPPSLVIPSRSQKGRC